MIRQSRPAIQNKTEDKLEINLKLTKNFFHLVLHCYD